MDANRDSEFAAMQREVADLVKRVAFLERELAWALNMPKAVSAPLPAAPLNIEDEDGA